MKNIIFSLFSLLLIVGSSCQGQIDIEKEKKAIIAVIEEEVIAQNVDRDFEKQSKLFVQDESPVILLGAKQFYEYGVGWKEIGSWYKARIENSPIPTTNTHQFTNYKIKVYKESAWAVFDEIVLDSAGELFRKIICVRFLEKVNGEWKIVYVGLIITSSYLEY